MSVSAPAFPWKKAAFLHERAAAGGPPPPPREGAALQDAERRAKAWRQLMSVDESLLEERLRSAGLDHASFLRLLTRGGQGDGETAGDEAWVDLIQEVLGSRYADEPLPPSLQAPEGPGQPGLLFSGFLQPFLRLGASRLRASRFPPGPEVETALLESLAIRLHELGSRVLILELNVARMMEQLAGDTPQARFHHFSTAWFQTPGVLGEVLGRYPVLARLMATALERWLAVSQELLERIAVDRSVLEEVFLGGRALGPLVAVRTGVSDLHRGGHGVALLQFGSGLRLVYKPKSLAVDVRFQELLQELNARGARHPHRLLRVVDRGSHGWVEFVDAMGCDSREALQRFYWRQGSSLALLQALAAVDFHLENLIAVGEYPVLVDLEALFHQRAPLPLGDSAYEQATLLLDRSVLSVGLLPQIVHGGMGGGGIDMSGLGGEPGQVSSQPMPAVEDAYHDTMRIVRKPGRTEGSNNRPHLDGQPVDPTGFIEDLVQGFEETYRLLLREREAFEPRLRAFAQVEVRHIARATQRYALLLEESHHPDFLRDGLERDKVLDHLWSEARVLPALRRLVPHEHADLRLGDIPIFSARPGERHLWSSTGECIPDFFERDSLSGVLERFARMDERDCANQVSLIRKSMVAIDKAQVGASPGARAARDAPREPLTPEECLAAAVAIGEELAGKAIHGRTDVGWLGVSLEDLRQWRWTLAPLGTELYEGVGGVALFFAHLAKHSGRGDFEALARAALEPVRREWKRKPALEEKGVGPFLGRSSAVYVLGHLALLWNEPALMDEALAGLSALEPLIDTDTRLDVLSGSAGCALVMLGLHRRTGEARFLEAAKRCGERLLATAEPCPGGGVGWKGAGGERPLAGFSHGATGFALALAELASATGDARYGERAREALVYERSLFVPERGNWKDLRDREGVPVEGPDRFMVRWCHGAPGIALGRLCSPRLREGPELRAELEMALETTLREGFGGGHCLCHGDLGNVEALLMAGGVLQEPRWTRLALERAAEALREAREGGWRCGLPRHTESPGMMMGLAGIGYGLLRLAAPERVPSVLTLALP